MSFIKPDFDYTPSVTLASNFEKKDYEPQEKVLSGSDLIPFIQIFSKQLPDEEMARFYSNVCLNFRTSVNVSDSESFLKKFLESFLFSIEKSFPDISQEGLLEIKEKMSILEKTLALHLKQVNLENKYLLPLALGLIEAMLNYESY